MGIFTLTLNQMAFLFALIIAGFVLAKSRVLPGNAAGVLAKLENTLFIPALVMVTFIQKFTVESLSTAWKPFVLSFVIFAVVMPIAIFISKKCGKGDSYIANIYTYGLCFSNFGFMGNAVVSKLYPEYFFEYLIFTLPLWIMIYVWGAPVLLMTEVTGEKQSFKSRMKAFVNPMFIAMLIGMVIGITGLKLPSFVNTTLDSCANCMSPIAMLLTGITVATTDLKKTFTDGMIYLVSLIRLIAFPLVGIAVFAFLPLPVSTITCVVCSLAMPLGLNTIVIPSAYGKDTSKAAGMAIVSHLLSCITIPLMLMLMTALL